MERDANATAAVVNLDVDTGMTHQAAAAAAEASRAGESDLAKALQK